MLVSVVRSRFNSCYIVGSIYCIGGSNGRHDLISVEKYDPTVGTWQNVAPLNHFRYNAAAVEVDKKIYVMGGK